MLSFAAAFARSILFVWLSTAAVAATVNLPGAVEPGHDRPLPQPEARPNFDFSIVAPRRSPVPRAVDEIYFKLSNIRIEGATVIPAEQFTHLFAGLRGHMITLATIFDIADGIEKEYRAAGYLLVRAYVPPQHVNNGVFTIRVVEGFVASTIIQGGGPSARRKVKSYLNPVLVERPLRLATIERALLLSNAIPGVAATGVLRPSQSVPAASDLVVTLVQPPVTAELSANNRGSHFSGIWTTTGTVAYNGILGADELDATLTLSPNKLDEQMAGQLRYRTAIGSDGLAGTIFAAGTDGAPGGSLGKAEIRSKSWAVGPRLTYPLISSRANSITLGAGITAQEARVTILGVGIYHDVWRVADFSIAYSGNDFLAGDMSSAVDVVQGLPFLGASPNHSAELSLDGRTTFTKVAGEFRYTNDLAAPFTFNISGSAQYAFEPLITGEQILFGGTQIGRGYDPGAITGDSGAGGSFELRYDTRWSDLAIEFLQPYAYLDAAKVENLRRPPTAGIPLANFSIASTGLGLRIWLPYHIYFDLEGSHTLEAVPGSDGGKCATKLLTDVAVTF